MATNVAADSDGAQCDPGSQGSAAPRASIIIVAHRNRKRLETCLRSLSAGGTEGVSHETIVLLNGADPPLRELLESPPSGVQMLLSENNLGFIAGCNAAASLSRSEFIVLLNDDTEVEVNWLAGLVDVADAYPGAGAVGSCVLFPDGRLQEAGSVVWQDGSTAPVGRGDDPNAPPYSFVREVDYCSGCSLLVRREEWMRLNGLNDRYHPMYYDDVDLSFALRLAGRRVMYSPLSRVVHAESQTAEPTLKRALFARNRRIFRDAWAADLAYLPTAGTDRARIARASHRARGWLPRLLVIDDRVPEREFGSGFGRALDTMIEAAQGGYSVTICAAEGRRQPTRELSLHGIEVVSEHVERHLATSDRFYDAVLISRPHNFTRFWPHVRSSQPQALLIYDAEAVFHRRLERLALLGIPESAHASEAAQQMRQTEVAIRAHVDAVVSVSDEEAAFFARTPGTAPVTTMQLHSVEAIPSAEPGHERNGIAFVAGWGGGVDSPNADGLRWFVREVLPEIRRECPTARLFVTGDCPRPLRDECGAGVSFLGILPSPAWLYERVRLAIAPLRFGSGVKYKTVEAIQYGVPVVATSVGAEGVNAARALFVADLPGEFAAAVCKLHGDDAAWAAARAASVQMGRQRTDRRTWSALLDEWLERRADLRTREAIVGDVSAKESVCVFT